ncbi:putative SLACS retrotransposable element [Trypanosoma cruzi]|uniref:Putative SLACS retrotransposable element n=1 Tax=Trypanosoma cruzi TaxID=5693 RepID=A0A2V2V1N9_TRYCR|nr:putative SLACS retrotransposable element [Trypanosoma cruzi]
MAYSKRGMPMPFDFRNGRTDNDWTTGGRRQQPPRYMTRSAAASRIPFIHRDNVDPSQLQDIITAATTEAIKMLTSPTKGRYTENNGNRSWRSRSWRPNRRDAELLWRSQQPQGGPQMIQGGNRSWQYRDQQPRRYRSQSSLERNNTPAQASRRTQQEVRPGSQGVRRGASQEQRGPQINTATPSLPGRREVAQGLPHAGFRGQLTRPKNPHAAIAALAELELQAYQEKHQRYIGATKTLVPWWTALYQSGAQNYHCPLCSFNRPGEHDVFYHCRQAHPTYDKCYPYRLHLNGHCTFPVEKSCSLNAVLAVLSHYEDESQLSQEVRSTYTVPCRENTERIIRAMEVNLPLAPVSALELLIKNDSKLRRMFSTTAVAGTQCEVCGWALPMEEAYPSYSETLQEEPAVITLQPGKRAPIHLTQTVLMQQYRSTWISEEHVCTGEQLARHHPKWAMTATKSRKFDDAVALEFGHWDKQAMGVEEVPFVILLPHQNGTAEYGLVGLVATNTPNHVVAYIPSALHKDTEWVMIDGMVQRVQRKPINTHKVILCLYRRLMPEMGPEEDEEDDEQESHARHREQDGRTLASAPKGSRLHQSQKWEEAPDDSSMVDGFGKNGYGQPPGSATHSSPPASSSPSTQTITQDPFLPPIAPRKRGRRGEEQEEESEGEGNTGGGIVCEEDEEGLLQPSVPPTSSQPNQQAPQGHFLDEEEEEITMRRTQPQATPHNNKKRRHHTNNHLCPRTKWRWRRKVWEATRGNQKHRDTLQVRKTVDTHFHTTRRQRCWIPCGVWQVGATTVSRDRVVGNTYDRIFMQSTVSRNGWTSPMKRSSRKDWFGVTRAGKFARPACEHGQHIDHAVATTHVGRKTLRHSGRSTGRRLPDPTIPRRRRVWNGHPPWNGRRHRPPTRGKTRGCRKECRRDVTSTSASGPTGWMYAAQSCWDTTPRRRTNAAANRWPLWTWCDTTYDCRRNRVVVATPPAPTTTSSITPTPHRPFQQHDRRRRAER